MAQLDWVGFDGEWDGARLTAYRDLIAGGVIWVGLGGQIFALEPLERGLGFRRIQPDHSSGIEQSSPGEPQGGVLVEGYRVRVGDRADTGVSPLRRALRALE